MSSRTHFFHCLSQKKYGTTQAGHGLCDVKKQTQPDAHPLPLIDKILKGLKGHKIFSKIDLQEAYHQVKMDADSEIKTPFKCSFGTFKFNIMQFGL
jgi:hypothetical protein